MSQLLTPDLLACVGKRNEPVTELVTRREIRRYAVATQQRLDKYLRGDEAPPMFYSRFLKPIPPMEKMLPDGRFTEDLIPPMPLTRTMAGGVEMTLHRPIRPGDELTAVQTIVDLYEKEGSSGPLIFAITETQVTDAQGQPVVTERNTRIFR